MNTYSHQTFWTESHRQGLVWCPKHIHGQSSFEWWNDQNWPLMLLICGALKWQRIKKVSGSTTPWNIPGFVFTADMPSKERGIPAKDLSWWTFWKNVSWDSFRPSWNWSPSKPGNIKRSSKMQQNLWRRRWVFWRREQCSQRCYVVCPQGNVYFVISSAIGNPLNTDKNFKTG